LTGCVVITKGSHWGAANAKQWQEQGLVFPNAFGEPREPSNGLKRIKATLRAAGLPEQRFHDLRH
jgi:integrase